MTLDSLQLLVKGCLSQSRQVGYNFKLEVGWFMNHDYWIADGFGLLPPAPLSGDVIFGWPLSGSLEMRTTKTTLSRGQSLAYPKVSYVRIPWWTMPSLLPLPRSPTGIIWQVLTSKDVISRLNEFALQGEIRKVGHGRLHPPRPSISSPFILNKWIFSRHSLSLGACTYYVF